jgi:uncharacterized protein (TIGR03437 family)
MLGVEVALQLFSRAAAAAFLVLYVPAALLSQTPQFSVMDPQGDVFLGVDESVTIGPGGDCFIYNDCFTTTYYIFYVHKVNPDGTEAAFSTSVEGWGTGIGTAMAADASGNLYVAGLLDLTNAMSPSTSYGANLPAANRISWIGLLDGVSGTLLNATYFDGDIAQLLVDPQRNVVACGSHPQPTLPISLGSSHLLGTTVGPYCARLDPTLSRLEFATTIGGSAGDILTSAVLDLAGNLYVAGNALSVPGNTKAGPGLDPFLTTPGALRQMPGQQNIFAAKFAPSGALVYSAVFGSSGTDTLQAITADGAGNLYLAGTPGASNFPASGGQSMPSNPGTFIGKLAPDASTLLYSVGLPLVESTHSLALDGQGDLYFAGASTYSGPTNYVPTVMASSYCAGAGAGIEAEFADNGSLVFSTYIFPGPLLYLYHSGKILEGYEAPYGFFDPAVAQSGVMCALNSANLEDELLQITSGELISIFGSGIGPTQAVVTQPVNGIVPSSAGGVTVNIAGKNVPILYASENQINAVVPFSLPLDQPTTIQVTNNGTVLNPLQYYATSAQQIGIFTRDNTPYGDAIAFNQDGTLNSATNPAYKGSTISFFATGLGALHPWPPEGSVGTGAAVSFPPLTLEFDNNYPATTDSFFDMSGTVLGVIGINVEIPASVKDTGRIPINLNDGSLAASIYVQ